MEIVFTGGSSFTGMWFCKKLCEAGHRLTIPLLHAKESYSGTRRERVEALEKYGELLYECPFGSAQFLALLASKPRWDLLCHHAADVTDYKSPSFNYVEALRKNSLNIGQTLQLLSSKQCGKLLLTGSVFEPGEGAGSDRLRAVSPYGLSKGLTFQVFDYFCSLSGTTLGKFVIPNPFGPWEEERFTSYLIKRWVEGKSAPVTHPAYIRDNIHASLLADAYRAFAESLKEGEGCRKINPSGYVGSQGAFTERFAQEMRQRLSLPCEIELLEQQDFTEPRERYNTDRLDIEQLQWNEAAAWDELADYYSKKYRQKPLRIS